MVCTGFFGSGGVGVDDFIRGRMGHGFCLFMSIGYKCVGCLVVTEFCVSRFV